MTKPAVWFSSRAHGLPIYLSSYENAFRVVCVGPAALQGKGSERTIQSYSEGGV